MIRLSVQEAQQRFSELLAAARTGEIVEIQQNGWMYRLMAVAARERAPVSAIPKAGRLKGQLVVPDDFDEPLDELREYME